MYGYKDLKPEQKKVLKSFVEGCLYHFQLGMANPCVMRCCLQFFNTKKRTNWKTSICLIVSPYISLAILLGTIYLLHLSATKRVQAISVEKSSSLCYSSSVESSHAIYITCSVTIFSPLLILVVRCTDCLVHEKMTHTFDLLAIFLSPYISFCIHCCYYLWPHC